MSALKLPEIPIPEQLRRPLKWVGYPLFAILVFVLALYASLPKERIQDQVLALAGDWLGADVKTNEFGLTLLMPGVKGSGVTITQRQPPGVVLPAGPDGKPGKPWRIPVDDAQLTFGPLKMLRGFTDLAWKAHLAQGSLTGSYSFIPTEARLDVDVAEVQLKSFPMLPAAIGIAGVPVEGQLSFKGDLTAPTGLFAQSDGSFQLTLANAVVGDGKAKVTIPGTPLAGGLTLPKVNLGKIAGDATLTKGRVQLRDLKGHSPDLELEIDGYVELRDPLSTSQLHIYVKLKPSEALLKREAGLEAMVNLGGAVAKRVDGFYGITIEGTPTIPRILPSTTTPAWVTAKPAPPPAVKPPGSPSPPGPRTTPPTPPRFDSTPTPPLVPPPPMPPPPAPSPPPAESPAVNPSVAPPPAPVAPPPAEMPTSVTTPPPPRLGVSARGFGMPGTASAPPPSDEARNTENPEPAPAQ